jgi:hypothetical protein
MLNAPTICVLSGGLVHVIATNQHYHPVYGYLDLTENIDNVVVKGFTFTGLMRGSGVFGGVPIAISHPGQNIRFEDCVWRDMTASKRVFWVGTNYLMSPLGLQVHAMSTEVSIENCLFEDIYYEEEYLSAFQQSLHIKRTTFRDVRLPELLPAGCSVILMVVVTCFIVKVVVVPVIVQSNLSVSIDSQRPVPLPLLLHRKLNGKVLAQTYGEGQ